jgi:fructoselysine-6-P-deglycase FrlB-like protein
MNRALGSRLWTEALAMPDTLSATLAGRTGLDGLADLLRGAERIIATGNGAAYYVTQALWLASLAGEPGPPLFGVPAGLLGRGRFEWRKGDVLLAVSSSGEQRDIVEALEAGAAPPYGAITAAPDSTIGRAAAAVAQVAVASQEAVTHTQGFAGNIVAALAAWARVTGDGGLAAALDTAPSVVGRALGEAEAWIEETVVPDAPRTAIVFGSGYAWPAALETALLLKEVTRLPAEGMETREGGTTGMYALDTGQLVLTLPTGSDALLAEAEQTCAATGASVLRVPGGALADPRLATLSTFPAALALSIALGREAGHDVDRPAWADAYFATARVSDTREV